MKIDACIFIFGLLAAAMPASLGQSKDGDAGKKSAGRNTHKSSEDYGECPVGDLRSGKRVTAKQLAACIAQGVFPQDIPTEVEDAAPKAWGLLDDGDPDVRWKAVRSLREAYPKTKIVVRLLIYASKSKDVKVRREAVDGLFIVAKEHNQQFMPEIIEALRDAYLDRDFDVRYSARTALKSIGVSPR